MVGSRTSLVPVAEWTKKEEQIKAGVYTKKQLQTAEQMHTDIGQHVDDYLAHLEAAGVSDEHFANVRRHLWAGIKKCGFANLAKLVLGWENRPANVLVSEQV